MAKATAVFGPPFFGIVINIMLYGITISQLSEYFRHGGSKDRTRMKVFVLVVFLTDTLQTIFDVAYAYDRLLIHFGDTVSLGISAPTFVAHPILVAIVSALVQLFFTWRLQILTGSRVLVVMIASCSFAQFCGGVGTSIAAVRVPVLSEFYKIKVVLIIWLAFSAMADTLIAVSLVWHLRKQRTGFAATDDIINHIIRFAIQTGSITAAFAIADMTCFLVITGSTHFTFNFVLPKLYAISFMSSLNSRTNINPGVTNPHKVTPIRWQQMRSSTACDTELQSDVGVKRPSSIYDGNKKGCHILVEMETMESTEDGLSFRSSHKANESSPDVLAPSP